jgi:hypothetical protein
MSLIKTIGGILLKIILAIFVFIIIYFLVFSVNQITGSDDSIFRNKQYYFFEKITYLLKPPQIGDIVLFKYDNASTDIDYVGVVINTERSKEDKLTYVIVNRLNPKNTFLITRENFVARAIYPQSNLNKNDIDLILNNLSTYKEEQTKKSYNVPGTMIDSSTNITGVVYVDKNGNGQLDSGEKTPTQYYPNVALDRTDRQYRYEMVNADINGNYSFSNISPGKYLVVFQEVPGYKIPNQEVHVEVIKGKLITINCGLIPN